jgi:hypothetical protein
MEIARGLSWLSSVGRAIEERRRDTVANVHCRAHASAAEATAPKEPTSIVKVTKPSDGQATTVDLGYQQQARIDLSSVAG